MRFVVGTPKSPEEQDVKVFFWLEEDDGDIILKAKREDDNDEHSWNILVISSEGLYRVATVGDDLGFPLDDYNDRILLKE